jgi:hypothetical protein
MLTSFTFPKEPPVTAIFTPVRQFARLWHASRPLAALALLMIGALAVSAVGLVVDDRMITGAPAWLKPAKFALSIAVYSLTLAWAFTYLGDWPRTRRIVSWTTAVVLALEVAIIDLQAWRGTASHFNVATPLDTALFAVMGAAIVIQTIASVFVAYALWRQTFRDRAMGCALRAGMTITIIGAASGGLMTSPTRAQMETLRETHAMRVSGAHTVGAPDGGPGLPGTGWSLEHGDLRVPHFVGLHAVQVLPLIALALRRRTTRERAARMMPAFAVSYAVLFGLLLAQALRGEPVLTPGALTSSLIALWAALTAAALVMTHRAPVIFESGTVKV